MPIASHIASIRANIPAGVTLVCVSKFHSEKAIMEAYQCGERDFGESRVQELMTKYEALPKDIRWHFIGHLQTNKVKQIVPFVHMIHSVDSVRLMDVINREAEKIGRRVKVLLEVHVAKEETKSGFMPEDYLSLITHSSSLITNYPWVEVCGVMGMATNTDDAQEWRRCFREIKSLGKQLLNNTTPSYTTLHNPTLQISMGMSDDYLVAIEEGSTMVRIGSTIFGSRGSTPENNRIPESRIKKSKTMTIILDMGGVLMNHNMPECIARFTDILGEEHMKTMLGLASNGEGTADSLMEQYERGEVSTDHFVNSIIEHGKEGTTREEVISAWNAMHGGIPSERLQLIQSWKDAGHRLFLLSNNNELHWEHILSQYDMSMFEYCFASHLIHMSKPDSRIYEAVDKQLREWGCEQPFHFVDDIEINRKAAEQLGWKTYETIYEVVL